MTVEPTRILQIVPRLYPDVDGVGDYALQLAHELCDRSQIHSEFLVFRPHPQLPPRVDRFPVHRLDCHTVQDLLDQVPQNISTIILQYSNYPYVLGKLDRPLWLVDALTALKQRGLKIVVMFHELPTLRYKQIRCPNIIQRRVSKGLAQVADAVITNNAAFQRTLAPWTRAPVHCIANFSTVGEVQPVPPLAQRRRSLVVFGSSDRTRVYRRNTDTLNHICHTLNIETLYDVGRPLQEIPRLTVPVIKTGFLPAAAVSNLLANSLAGLFDYRRFPHNLTKSTVYAAYCSHGLVPICNGGGLPPQDGIAAGHHYLVPSSLQAFAQPSLLQAIADNAQAHYRSRTLAQGAARFAQILRPTAASPSYAYTRYS